MRAVVRVGLGLCVVVLFGCKEGVGSDGELACRPMGEAHLAEVLETRCDGIDNDCDGLVDVLLPMGPNACATGARGVCGAGFATCVSGVRACQGPGPSPEVYDGLDNDCDGTVDNVPPASVRARALWLVPEYVWTEAPGELASLAALLDMWGVPYDRPAQGSDLGAGLAVLPDYALAIVPGYLLGTSVSPAVADALLAFARAGGVVLVFRPIDNATSEATRLTGLSRVSFTRAADTLRTDPMRAPAVRSFDSPEERSVPLADPRTSPIEVQLLEPDPAVGTVMVSEALADGRALGAVLTRRPVGQGAIYAAGHDFRSFDHYRCYINCFEPTGDLLGLFLRDALREGARGHVVFKHTVAGPEDGALIVSHDIDAPEAHNAGAWGEPGAVQMARVEQRYGVQGTYYATTDYVARYYNESTMRALCELGQCPLAAHSVHHNDDFATQPKGTCTETRATYPNGQRTLCGELRVSRELLEAATGQPVTAWRSPYLHVHPEQYATLDALGFTSDSSYAVGDLKFNLPVSAERMEVLQQAFHHKPLLSLSITIEDGIGAILPNGQETRDELQLGNLSKFMTLWHYALLRNADNGALTHLLVHPSGGRTLGARNLPSKVRAVDQFLGLAAARGIKTVSVPRLVTDWRAREATDVDARYDNGLYRGALRTGRFAVRGLTLEFGDAVARFDCASCGPATVTGKRVVIAGPLSADTRFAFTANARTSFP